MHITRRVSLSDVALSLVGGVLVLQKALVPEVLVMHFVCCLFQVLHVCPVEHRGMPCHSEVSIVANVYKITPINWNGPCPYEYHSHNFQYTVHTMHAGTIRWEYISYFIMDTVYKITWHARDSSRLLHTHHIIHIIAKKIVQAYFARCVTYFWLTPL